MLAWIMNLDFAAGPTDAIASGTRRMRRMRATSKRKKGRRC